MKTAIQFQALPSITVHHIAKDSLLYVLHLKDYLGYVNNLFTHYV